MEWRLYTPFTLDQLTTFLAVLDEGSFSAAARRLGRVQSAVSYTIAQLEDGLGTQLFDRAGHRPAPTEAGRRLAAEARLVLARSRDLTEVAAQLRGGVEPELRVVVDALYPSDRLTEVCAAFSDAFPATLLRLDVGILGETVAALSRGDADLGACNLAGGAPDELVAAHLGTVSAIPVCAAHHPLASVPAPQAASVLEQHVQIVHAERTTATVDQGVLASRTWRVTDLAVKAAWIRRGLGWGNLPPELALPGVQRGELVRLRPEPWPDGHVLPLHAVVRRDRPLGRAGQWFRERLQLG